VEFSSTPYAPSLSEIQVRVSAGRPSTAVVDRFGA
jgi:hypothetical protein